MVTIVGFQELAEILFLGALLEAQTYIEEAGI